MNSAKQTLRHLPVLLLLLVFALPASAQQTEGLASYYADRFHNKPTSTGEKHNKNGFMAASLEYNYGTVLEVTNVVNGKKVEVKVNDCGPHHPDRIIDLSKAAAAKIGLLKAGTGMVSLRVVEESDLGPTCHRRAWAKAQREAKEKAAKAAKKTTPTVASRQPTVAVLGNPPSAPATATIGNPVPGPAPTVADPSRSAAKTPAPAAPPTESPAPAPATYEGTAEVSNTPQFAPDDIIYGVQVGAFSKAANAEAAVNKLVGLGFTEVWSVQVGKVYRIFAGKFYFSTQAEEYKKELRKAGYGDASVRRVQ